jgi:hypothetical protein
MAFVLSHTDTNKHYVICNVHTLSSDMHVSTAAEYYPELLEARVYTSAEGQSP